MIPLDVFRREMRMHPWHFWGMTNTVVPVSSSCGDVLGEDAWQMRDRLGRNEISRALAEAERVVRDYCGFWPSVHWMTERVPVADRVLGASGKFTDPQGRFRPVVTKEKMLIGLGQRTQVAIGTATVVLTDSNNDGLPDTFTATTTATTTVTDETQISVTGPNGVAGAGFDDQIIAPLAISFDGTGHVVVAGPAWLLADRTKQANTQGFAGLDPLAVGTLFTSVKVWHDYTKDDGTTTDTSMAVLRMENVPSGCCCSAGTDPAGVTLAVGRAGIRNKRAGVVFPAEAVWDAVAAKWTFRPVTGWCWNSPDEVDLRLCAGLTDGSADTVVCRLAAAMMTSPVCACDIANAEVARWQEDLAVTGGNTGFAVSSSDLENPLGTRRGQIAAWRWIMEHRVANTTLL